jgi:hypothetical protein
LKGEERDQEKQIQKLKGRKFVLFFFSLLLSVSVSVSVSVCLCLCLSVSVSPSLCLCRSLSQSLTIADTLLDDTRSDLSHFRLHSDVKLLFLERSSSECLHRRSELRIVPVSDCGLFARGLSERKREKVEKKKKTEEKHTERRKGATEGREGRERREKSWETCGEKKGETMEERE